jgi:predicted histone-like DNA-binding protein
MTLQFRPVKKKNPAKPGDPVKYFPNPVFTGKVSLRNLANEIARRTSMSTADTIAVLEACTAVIPDFLTDGAIVSLGDFGTFRLTMKGEGAPSGKELNASHITDVRVKFRPGKEFSDRIKMAKLKKESKKS